MSVVTQTKSCCALYELANISGDEPTDVLIQNHLDTIGQLSYPKGTLPLIVFFSDAAKANIQPTWGRMWAEKLRSMGYRVDEFKLGKNPKSPNHVTLYHWWLHKGVESKKPSLVTEYYGQKDNNSVPRTAARKTVAKRGTRGALLQRRKLGPGFGW